MGATILIVDADGEGVFQLAFLYDVDTPVVDANGVPVALTPLSDWNAAVPADATQDFLTDPERAELDAGTLAFEIDIMDIRQKDRFGRPIPPKDAVAEARRRYAKKKAQFLARERKTWLQVGRRISVP